MNGSQITGLVALVEDEFTLVINKGAEAGVVPGMIFAVFTDDGQLITDPETGRELGRLSEEKLRVKVFDVRELFARAETYSTGAQRPTAPASVNTKADYSRSYGTPIFADAPVPIFDGMAELAGIAGDTLVADLPAIATAGEVVTVNIGDTVELVDTLPR